MKQLILIPLCLLIIQLNGSCQSQLSLKAAYILGTQFSSVSIGGDELVDYKSSGYNGTLEYRYRFKFNEAKWSAGAELGYKQINATGNTNQDAFDSKASKFVMGVNAFYRINNFWTAGIGLQIENNEDADHLRFIQSDVFRQNILLRNEFRLLRKLALTFDYSRVLSPNVDAYLISNPSDQFLIGIKFQML